MATNLDRQTPTCLQLWSLTPVMKFPGLSLFSFSDSKFMRSILKSSNLKKVVQWWFSKNIICFVSTLYSWWKLIFMWIQSAGLQSWDQDASLDTHINRTYVRHLSSLTSVNYVRCQQWQMTMKYDVILIWVSKDASGCQDCSQALRIYLKICFQLRKLKIRLSPFPPIVHFMANAL